MNVSKCDHGVFLASATEVETKTARYCSLCSPQVDKDVIDVVLVVIGTLMRARRAVQVAANRRVGAKRMLRTKRRKAALSQKGGAL
jgi:hypothetical protein